MVSLDLCQKTELIICAADLYANAASNEAYFDGQSIFSVLARTLRDLSQTHTSWNRILYSLHQKELLLQSSKFQYRFRSNGMNT
jgi:hypothetical protein